MHSSLWYDNYSSGSETDNFKGWVSSQRLRNDLLVSEVASLVVSHVTLGPEALAASLWAVEGALVDMDALVDA